MAVYTYELATDYNFSHINLYRRYKDGVFNGWKAETEEGYVMYDSTANDTEFDPITMEERPVTYYYVGTTLPKNYNIDNFPYIAVPRDSVDENYIFGVGDNNDHEVM